MPDTSAKRDFARTPEPSGRGRGSRKAGRLYVIQKHAATPPALRLPARARRRAAELGRAKGPSLDPQDKRLAVHVEDHPLDYGDFEGTIPEGEYGGGTVMLWDRGTWEPQGDPSTRR